jgi:hypothetical protein
MCRRCWKEPATIQHITAACEHLARTECVKRRDGVAKVIHQKLAEAAELIEDNCQYYRYKPANVLENDNFKLYWNRSIITDRTVPSNWPDMTVTNKKTKKYLCNRHSYSKYTQSRQNSNRKTKQIPRTGERRTWYVEAGRSTSGPDSNFSYGNDSKVTVTKSKET